MEYLIRFVQAYETFRHPEIEALARLANVKVEIIQYSSETPFCIVRIEPQSPTSKSPDEIAASFISRSFLSKGIYELWGEATDYESLHEIIKNETSHLWSKYEDIPFKFTVDAFYGKRSMQEQKDIINSFRYLGFKGKPVMKNPQLHFTVFEEWEDNSAMYSLANLELSKSTSQSPSLGEQIPTKARKPKRIFLARHIGDTSRHLADKHDLKKRPYISTTSMDALLALITANLALASPGKFFLDPFVGTGGFMIAASELGALTLGSDIDGRSFRGKGQGIEKGVGANVKKYGLKSLFADCITSDLTNSPFRITNSASSTSNSSSVQKRSTRWLDGIISDPPYGIREGLKVLGVRRSQLDRAVRISDKNSTEPNSVGPYLIEGTPSYLLPGYIPPKKPYSFTAMLDDILNFAAATLVDGGRLAFWMPTANESSDEEGEGEVEVEGTSTPNTTSNKESKESNNVPTAATKVNETNSTSTRIQTQQETDPSIPTHHLLVLQHICTQSFNKWSRKLLVYERIPDPPPLPPTTTTTTNAIPNQNQDQNRNHSNKETSMSSSSITTSNDINSNSNPNSNSNTNTNTRIKADDLNSFRRKYFKGFQNV